MSVIRRMLYALMAAVCVMACALAPAHAQDLPLYDPGYPYYGYEVVPEDEEGTLPDDTEGGAYVYAPHPSLDYTDYMFMHYMGWKPTEEETEGQPLLYTYPSGNAFGFSEDSIEKAIVPAGAVTAGFSRDLELASVDMSRARKLKFLSMDACYKVKTLDIPYGVEGVVLNHLTGLTRLTLPPTVKFLELWHLDSLANLDIPQGVEYLSVRDCGKLKSLTLPRSVKAVFRHAFKGCSSLSSITIYGDSAPEFTSDASPFKGTKISTVYIKDASTENAKLWKSRSGKAVKSIDGAYAVHFVYGGDGQEILSDARAGGKLVRPIDPVREGYALSGWYQDEALTQEWDFAQDKMPEEELTLFAGWAKQCRISFVLDNGMRMLDEFAAPGERIAEPIAPAKDGHQFTGWYRDSACTKPWRFDRDVVECDTEMTLYAGWKYTVTAGLMVQGDEAVLGRLAFAQEETVIPESMAGIRITGLGEYSIPAGVKRIVLPAGISSVDEKAFADASDLMEISVDPENTAYFAEEGVLYSADGSLICYPQAKSGEAFSVPSAVKTVGAYAFMNVQYLNAVTFSADVRVDDTAFEGAQAVCLGGPADAANLIAFSDRRGILYNQYTVKYISEGHTVKEVVCRAGEKIPACEAVVREYHLLLGWRDEEGAYWELDADAMPRKNLTLEAHWQYAFAYTAQNGEVTIEKYLGDSLYVKVPSRIENLPVTAITRDAFAQMAGLTLAGDKQSAAEAFAAQVGCEFELLTHTLSFVTNGAAAIEARKLCATAEIELPEIIRNNYNLIGWYTDAALTQRFAEGTVMPAGDLTLYAAWQKRDTTVPYECETYGSGVRITAYVGDAQTLTVPESIAGEPVLAIAEYAFSGSSITSITLPDSVTEIGQYAFKDCKNLEMVTLPANLTAIEEGLFEGCSKLLYYNQQYLELLYNRPIKRIEKRAFSGSGLAYLYIPATVESIDIRAFEDCGKMNEVYVHRDNAHYASYEDALYDSGKTTLLYYPQAKTDYSYTVPQTVKTIGAYAVQDNDYLTDMMGMTSVEHIEEGAFKDCGNLWIWQVGSALKTIGVSAFENCGRIALSSIPDSVTKIESKAFAGCKATSFAVGPHTEIADDAFNPEKLEKVYGIPGSPAHEWAKKHGVKFVLSLDEQQVWVSLDWLYTEMEIGESMKLNYGFYPEDAEDRTVTWSSSAPHIASIDDNGVVTALFEGDVRIMAASSTLNQTEMLLRVTRSSPEAEEILLSQDAVIMSIDDSIVLKADVLPANADDTALTWHTSDKTVATCTGGAIKAVGEGTATITVTLGEVSAQCHVRVFKSALVLPESLQIIPEEAFANTAVVCIECPQGLKEIGRRAFADCVMLERIRMGGEVQRIAGDAFEDCEKVVIFAPAGSYAIDWAKENGISYQEE